MKHILNDINKVFDHRVRLAIMSVLVVSESMDFNAIKDLLGVTDGNLASHSKALEKEKYIEVVKQFIGKKPNTRYRITKLGKEAFQAHIDALEKLIHKT